MITFFFVLQSLFTSPASDQGKQHFLIASWLYDKGAYEAALPELELAYRLSNEDTILFDLALTHFKCNNPYAALTALRQYIRRNPQRLTNPDVKKLADKVIAIINDYERQVFEQNCTFPFGCMFIAKSGLKQE